MLRNSHLFCLPSSLFLVSLKQWHRQEIVGAETRLSSVPVHVPANFMHLGVQLLDSPEKMDSPNSYPHSPPRSHNLKKSSQKPPRTPRVPIHLLSPLVKSAHQDRTELPRSILKTRSCTRVKDHSRIQFSPYNSVKLFPCDAESVQYRKPVSFRNWDEEDSDEELENCDANPRQLVFD